MKNLKKKSIISIFLFSLLLFTCGVLSISRFRTHNNRTPNIYDGENLLTESPVTYSKDGEKKEDVQIDTAEHPSYAQETASNTEHTDQNDNSEEPGIPPEFELMKLGKLQYYLYIPGNPTDNMPLIMYLHGGTNKQSDVTALLSTDGFPKYLYEGYFGDLRAYVVVPKLNSNYKGWSDISDNLRDLIKTINSNYKIDMSKVSLTGHSMGGTGTYQIQVKLPNTFSCIAPVSGSIRNTEANLTELAKTKIWAFVGTEDTIVDPDSSIEIINVLSSNGCDAKITELIGAGHFDVPALCYKNSELINWLVNCGD